MSNETPSKPHKHKWQAGKLWHCEHGCKPVVDKKENRFSIGCAHLAMIEWLENK